MDKVSSRRYGLLIGNVELTPSQLDEIRSNALNLLRDNHGFDVPAAWVEATVTYLVKMGAVTLPNEQIGVQAAFVDPNGYPTIR